MLNVWNRLAHVPLNQDIHLEHESLQGHWNGTGWQLALGYLGTGTGALMNFGHACLVELVDHFSSQRLGIQGVKSRSNIGNMFYHFLVQEVLQVPYQALVLLLKN